VLAVGFALARRQIAFHHMHAVNSLISIHPGTFGQNSPWDIFTPASWSHLRVPSEIMTDPQRMPAHPVPEGDASAGCTGGRGEQDIMEEKVHAEVGAGTPSSPVLPLWLPGRSTTSTSHRLRVEAWPTESS
jgi:hypothetical protein